MKNHIKVVGIGLVALAIAGFQFDLRAQQGDTPAMEQPAPKSQRALPFNGKLKAIDKETGTLTVGNRTFLITPETRYLQGNLESARVGEKVGGSYLKTEDGTLKVNSIRFGPKGGKEKAEDTATE